VKNFKEIQQHFIKIYQAHSKKYTRFMVYTSALYIYMRYTSML